MLSSLLSIFLETLLILFLGLFTFIVIGKSQFRILWILTFCLGALWIYPRSPTLGYPFGLNLTIFDVLVVQTTVYLIINLRKRESPKSTFLKIAVALYMFTLFKLVIGGLQYGINSAVVEARPQLLFFSLLAWLLSISDADALVNFLESWALKTSFLIAAWATYRLVFFGVGTYDGIDITQGFEQTSRVLVSLQALALLFLPTLFLPRSGRLTRIMAIAAVVGLILISQQRTVWISFATGLIVAGLARKSTFYLITGLYTGLVWYLVLILNFPNFLNWVTETLLDLATYETRFNMWQQLISRQFSKPFFELLIGSNYGAGFQHIDLNGNLSVISPHNFYVTLFLRLGLLGLLVFIVFLFKVYRSTSINSRTISKGVLVAVITFGFSYNFEHFIAVAIASALLPLPKGKSKKSGIESGHTHEFSN